MRVALYGNTCNNFFAVGRALRQASDIDAHLFIDSNAEFNQLPESEDSGLRGGYPHWIHKGPYHGAAARFWPGASPLVRELRTFDVVMVSGGGVRLAPFVDRPFIFYVTGWDLTVSPFPVRFLGRYRGLASKIAALLGGFWQRRGIGAVAQFWSQPFSPFRIAAERLGVARDRIVPRYFPIMVDTDLYRADPNARFLDHPDIRRIVDHHDFVLFHPSRLMVNRAAQYVETGQWKGNDRLVEGFARFVASARGARPVLVLIDRGQSADVAQIRALIAGLGIEQHVIWLKGPHPYGFDRGELLPFYSVADVVADEFGIGWFGSVVVEGLSMGKPVLCYLDEEVMRQLYPWHPILTPQTPDEIAACLFDLWRDPEERSRRGARGREWAVAFHSLEGASARYVLQVQQAVETVHAGV
jgi:glycosyltransferase involved in cell wall biosynthesis